MRKLTIHSVCRLTIISGLTFLGASCSKENIEPGGLTDISVTFSALSASAEEAEESLAPAGHATRAGQGGAMSDPLLRRAGFGVFAYHTGSKTWDGYRGDGNKATAPNFMYNQPVEYSFTKGVWEYAPVKYWPNDNRDADDEHATGSEEASYLSFFAYAPYVELMQNADASTDAATTTDADIAAEDRTGITAVTGNEAQGDVKVTYRMDEDPDKQVDLMWGTRGQLTYQEADGVNNTVGSLGKDVMNSDLTKQTTEEQVSFLFRHALASIDIYVQRIYDEVLPTDKKPENDRTRIYVSSLKLDAAAGDMYLQGQLNLMTGTWEVAPGDKTTKAFSMESKYATIAENIRGTTDPNSMLGNVQAIELDDFNGKLGVTETPERLYTTAFASMLIPTDATGSTLEGVAVTPSIQYNFVSEDDENPLGLPNSSGTHRYTRVQNMATGAPITIGTYDSVTGKYKLEAGKRYVLVCYIGTEHVSFRQTAVEDWDFPLRFVPGTEAGHDYQKEDDDTKVKGLSDE